jgi:hypothetical protein
MARGSGWAIFFALLLGILGTSLFWLYSPYLQDRVTQQVATAMKNREAQEMGREAGQELKGAASQALGPRFQLVADGKNVFLADLKEGRVWRYYHQTKEGGGKEDEGFLPIAVYFGGKKSYSAGEPEAPPARP